MVLAAMITVGILIALGLSILFWYSQFGRWVDGWLRKAAVIGPVIIRIALAGALYSSAVTGSFLGPEIRLNMLPGGAIIPFILYGISLLILFGLFTEIAAAIGLVLIILAAKAYGVYLLTYLSYVGALLVLTLIGARFFSIDQLLGRNKDDSHRFVRWETLIIRVFFGLALIYTAIVIKILHPAVPLTVVGQYNLTHYHWLFPSDPLLIALGAAMTEIAIGTMVILGFQIRTVMLVTLFYMTLSLLFFKEAVWPHLILFGISISLLLNNSGEFTLDDWLDRWFAKSRKQGKSKPLLVLDQKKQTHARLK